MRDGKAGIGVIGCGMISGVYLENLTSHLSGVEVLACADLIHERAVASAKRFGIPKAVSNRELIEDPDIDIVLNLTVPLAHAGINLEALEAGKHIYCEKPLAVTFEEAERIVALAAAKGLRVGGAPDTFLGAGLQTCRKLIDEGAIGRPTGFTANLICHGHELWYPTPLVHYAKGGGPVLDVGPYYFTTLVALLGPIRRIGGFARIHEPDRLVLGKPVDIEIPTSCSGILDFACGALGTVQMTFDVWKSRLPRLEIHGTEGSLFLPDPNFFGGPLRLLRSRDVVARIDAETTLEGRRDWLYEASDTLVEEVPLAWPERTNMRGYGVTEMAAAIREGRPHRVSGELALHVVEALTSFADSGTDGRIAEMRTPCGRPAPLPPGWPLWRDA